MIEKRHKVDFESIVATDYALLSEVYIDDEFFCYALERLWDDNKRRVSCIPSGTYKTKPYSSKKYPNVCEITDVEGRDKILIHSANYPWQLQGCIALGSNYVELGVYGGRETSAVFHSNNTIKAFYKKVGYDFDLTLDSECRDQEEKNEAIKKKII